MNHPIALEQLQKALSQSVKAFEQYNQQSGHFVNVNEEASRVYHLVKMSMFTPYDGLAATSLESIIDSFLNIAKTGLTIEAKARLAFLRTQYCHQTARNITLFDVTCRGYLTLIARTGKVNAITTDVIYDNDEFEFHGTRALVTHRVSALSIAKRGVFAGGYCSSELMDKTIITTVMTPEEMLAIETQAKKDHASAWHSPFIDELRRKTLLRRHWKTLSLLVLSQHAGLSQLDEGAVGQSTEANNMGGLISNYHGHDASHCGSPLVWEVDK